MSIATTTRRVGGSVKGKPKGTALPRLRRARLRLAWTQEELARASGVNQATISRLEVGGYGAFPGTVRRLAKALGVTPSALYGEEG